MSQKLQEWQILWHDAFDQDANLRADDDMERPDPLPDDIDTDFRLIFGLRFITAETRRVCFSVFPNGEELCRRYEDFLSKPPVAYSEEEARAMLKTLTQYVEAAGPEEELDWDRVHVVDPGVPEGEGRLASSSWLGMLFFDAKHELEGDEGLVEEFLTEPLYASAGNDYVLPDYLIGALMSNTYDRVFELAYRLWRGGWGVYPAADGITLADFRNTKSEARP